MSHGIFAVQNLEEYRDRVRRVVAAMEYVGYGAQTRCAADLVEQPITISRLLRGILVDENLLEDVEKWAQAQLAPKFIQQPISA